MSAPTMLLPAVAPTINGFSMPMLRRFTIDEYHRMIDQGVFAENENCELIDGLVVVKMAKNPPHESTLQRMLAILFRIIPAGWGLRPQQAITLSGSEPEPDITIVRGDDVPYRDRHPNPDDVGLLIEISDSSLEYDRGKKLALYARDRISEYWIVNLVDSVVEVYTRPSGPTAEPAYSSHLDFARGDAFALVLDGKEIVSLSVSELLP
jgi:Uma2 family endonuclease